MRTVVGLEIHVELNTRTKMFCPCLNMPDDPPNSHICPICLAHPGTLPTINKDAVEKVLLVGLALKGRIAPVAEFVRKNYFYPDLPKGYQISQHQRPFVKNAHFRVDKIKKTIGIHQIHLEEDTGKLLHRHAAKNLLIDYNRAGVPLMELISEPDFASGKEARIFAEELQLIFRYLDVSEANMEKSQMRCEVNISLVEQSAKDRLSGTKVEIKNLNSFRAIEGAINYEIKRQSRLLRNGKKVAQETRGWDEETAKTISQRWKESAQDYRYLPEPDLPPLLITREDGRAGVVDLEKLRLKIPELPHQKRKRFLKQLRLPPSQVEIIISDKTLADWFEQVSSELSEWVKEKREVHTLAETQKVRLWRRAAGMVTTHLVRILSEAHQTIKETKLTAENFAELIAMIELGEVSSSAARSILHEMIFSGADPSHIAEEKGLVQLSEDSRLEDLALQVIADHPKAVADYNSGNQNAIQFLIGQLMAKSKGRANPQKAKKIFAKVLAKSRQ